MDIYFITGISRGIGKALTLKALEQNKSKVFGFSRTNPGIFDTSFEWYHTDLSDTNEIENFEYPSISSYNPERIILINNAAIIGDINFSGKKDSGKIIKTYTTNIIAVSVLINKFMAIFCKYEVPKIIVNVSSGAGRHPIVSWSDYCATKSAMDMLSETINEELSFGSCQNTKIFSIAPGIVDTSMQEDIRQSGPERFPYHGTFVDYKNSGALWSPEFVADKFFEIINNPGNFNNVILDIRDF
jgi:benzil reductase ((S)-benzoin forming)